MKKVLLYSVLLIATLQFASAQTINGIDLLSIDSKYIDVDIQRRMLNPRVLVALDYGQERTSIDNRSTRILDRSGRPMEFNTEMDVLNFMDSIGYEYLDTYVTVANNTSNTHYILKRKEARDE